MIDNYKQNSRSDSVSKARSSTGEKHISYKRGRANPFEVSVAGGQYVGLAETLEEAIQMRDQYLQSHSYVKSLINGLPVKQWVANTELVYGVNEAEFNTWVFFKRTLTSPTSFTTREVTIALNEFKQIIANPTPDALCNLIIITPTETFVLRDYIRKHPPTGVAMQISPVPAHEQAILAQIQRLIAKGMSVLATSEELGISRYHVRRLLSLADEV